MRAWELEPSDELTIKHEFRSNEGYEFEVAETLTLGELLKWIKSRLEEERGREETEGD